MNPKFEEKIWGRTIEVMSSPFYSKYHLEMVGGGYCSLHYHRQRANRFRVKSGLVEIIEMYGVWVRRTRLGPEATYDVPSLVPHMFVVHRGGTMEEEYYPDRGGEVRNDDIIRLVIGGRLLPEDLGNLPYCILDLKAGLKEF